MGLKDLFNGIFNKNNADGTGGDFGSGGGDGGGSGGAGGRDGCSVSSKVSTTSDVTSGEISYKEQLDKNIVSTLKSSGTVKYGDKDSLDVRLEKETVRNVADNLSTSVKSSVGTEFLSDDTKIKLEDESSVKFGGDNTYAKIYNKSTNSVSTKDGLSTGVTAGGTIKAGPFSKTLEETVSASLDDEKAKLKAETKNITNVGYFSHTSKDSVNASFDGKKATIGSEHERTTKLGGKNTFIEGTNKHTNSKGTDGSKATSDTRGGKISVGGLEGGFKSTESNAHSKDKDAKGQETDTKTHKTENEVSGAIPVGEGVKLKGAMKSEKTEKVSENAESITTEKTQNTTPSIRVEVDSEKATASEALVAGMINLQAAAFEKTLAEGTKQTEKTTEMKGPSKEEIEADQKQAEEIEKKAEKNAAQEIKEAEGEARKENAELEKDQKQAENEVRTLESGNEVKALPEPSNQAPENDGYNYYDGYGY